MMTSFYAHVMRGQERENAHAEKRFEDTLAVGENILSKGTDVVILDSTVMMASRTGRRGLSVRCMRSLSRPCSE